MTEASQDIKIICQNSIIKGAHATSVDGHPLRNWKIKLVAMDGNKEKKGKLSALLDRVEYILHPTFANPRRVMNKEPYLLQEKGWGEFDMRIMLYFTRDLADPEIVLFDLNFAHSTYTVHHKLVFPMPSPELEALLSMDPVVDTTHTTSSHSSHYSNSHGSMNGSLNGSMNGSMNGSLNGSLNGSMNGSMNGPKKRRPSTSNPSNKAITKETKITHSPAIHKYDEMGTSASPSTPSFYSNKTVQYPIASTYSGSPLSPSFDSPALPISPAFDYGQAKIPQAYSEHDSVPYLSGLSDESQRKSASSGSSIKRGYESEEYEFPDYQHRFRPTYESSEGEEGDREDAIVDDVYEESDLKNVNPIHSMPLDAETRRAWGIPEGLDMMELARRLTHMTEAQAEEFHDIVKQCITDDMVIEEKEGELVLELYSLGPILLSRLWEYSEKITTYNSLLISPHFNAYDQESETEDS
ncbi:yeats family-domain-containing protein [Spinellus fusiger]|nr:yeats family-domain-containing protein [Spinellus fusiger]